MGKEPTFLPASVTTCPGEGSWPFQKTYVCTTSRPPSLAFCIRSGHICAPEETSTQPRDSKTHSTNCGGGPQRPHFPGRENRRARHAPKEEDEEQESGTHLGDAPGVVDGAGHQDPALAVHHHGLAVVGDGSRHRGGEQGNRDNGGGEARRRRGGHGPGRRGGKGGK